MSAISNSNYSPEWLKSKKVLIVEDESSNFELLKAMLRKADVEIVWAQNGMEAIKKCSSEEFQIILMDIKMPEMNGYEAVRRIREMGIDTPVIAQTAYARIEDEARILEMGFDNYISKPIDRRRLFSVIERFLNKDHSNI